MNDAIGNAIIQWGAIAAALGGLGYAGKKVIFGVRNAYRRFVAIMDLTEHELKHNSGSSTKDFAKAGKDSAAAAVEAAERATQAAEASTEAVQRLGERFDQYVATNTAQQQTTWTAIQSLARLLPVRSVEVQVTQTQEGTTDGNANNSAA